MTAWSDLGGAIPSPLVELCDRRFDDVGVRLFLKRDDLIHPEIPGNKWRKLKHNIHAAQAHKATTLLTFGGAYSNHLRATAAAGRHFGFRTIGIVRGEEHLPLNPSLEHAVANGMQLSYMDRSRYRQKNSPEVLADLHDRFGDFYLLPEGGSNELALPGCRELATEIGDDIDVVCCPCGTGGTLAGIAAGLRPGQRALGFSVLKGGEFLRDDIAALQRSALGEATNNWSVECGYHMGGYARRPTELDTFIDKFADEHGIHLEWVYVAKMMYGIYSLARDGGFEQETTVAAVLTG